MNIIRAKFRCLSIEQKWNGEIAVRLGPVKRGDGKDTENDFFWKYTPSGKAELVFHKTGARMRDGEVVMKNEASFKSGDYYYLDMQRRVDLTLPLGTWRINRIEHQDYGVTVGFYCQGDDEIGCTWSSLEMQLSAEAVGAREVLQPHGSKWHIAFTHAEASDG